MEFVRQGYVSKGWTDEGKRLRQRALDERLCVTCDVPLTGRQVYFCSESCSIGAWHKWWGADDWKKVRRQALDRDGGKCVKCGAPAVEVDHIVEIAIGGSEFDLDNLQSLCVPCHREKTRKFNSRKRV